MTRGDILRVSIRIPGLTARGVGVLGDSDVNAPAEHSSDQCASLLDDVETCTRLCAWLADKPRRRTLDDDRTSYILRRAATAELGVPVSNGAFIAAAVHSGFRFRLIPGSANVLFNIGGIWRGRPGR